MLCYVSVPLQTLYGAPFHHSTFYIRVHMFDVSGDASAEILVQNDGSVVLRCLFGLRCVCYYR